MVEISVRPATPADAAAIAAVNLASWEATYRGIVDDAFLNRQSLESRTDQWRAMLADGRSVLVAESRAGVLIGYCGLSLPARDPDTDTATAELAAIYVSPTAVRGGAGSALMARALEVSGALGYRELVLWVLTLNTPAQAFYAQHGFSADGTAKWLDDLGAEEIRMRRAL